MKLPNGYGGITKLKGNRRKPFMVRVTVGWTLSETGKQKQIYKTLGYFEKKKDALNALSEFHKNPYDLNTKTITFSEVYEKWSEPHFEKYPGSKGGLVSAYKKCEPLYKMKMNEIKKAHMQDVINNYSDQSEQSQTKLKTVFIQSFKYALENDICTKDYSQFLTINAPKVKKKKEKYFNNDELKKVFNNLDFICEYPISKKAYTSINLTDSVIILLYTGLRITELLELKISNIDLKKRTIFVEGTKTDSAERIVPIHNDLISLLEKLIKTNKEYLIEIEPGKPAINGTQYRKYFFEPYMLHLGLSHTPHALRHTFISIMDSNGVSANSVTLKRIVGHSDRTVTETYTHKDITELIEAIDKFKIK